MRGADIVCLASRQLKNTTTASHKKSVAMAYVEGLWKHRRVRIDLAK